MREAGRGRSGAERDVGFGLAFTLVVAVPTLVVAEDWHGRPMIDQGGFAWLVPAVLVVGASLVVGAALVDGVSLVVGGVGPAAREDAQGRFTAGDAAREVVRGERGMGARPVAGVAAAGRGGSVARRCHTGWAEAELPSSSLASTSRVRPWSSPSGQKTNASTRRSWCSSRS